MATAAYLQTAWSCHWSRAGHRITGLAETVQPESLWVCTRGGARHSVVDEDCAHGARWEPLATAAAPLTVVAASHSILAADAVPMAVRARVAADDIAQAALRTVLVLIAIAFFALGFVVLTRPLAIPLTWALWLCGAIPLVAACGRFPARTDSEI